MKTLALLSDSTGDLGERFLRALVSQFPKDVFSLRVFSFIDEKEDLTSTFRQLENLAPILFHTTMHTDLKKRIEVFARAHQLPVYDLTGGAMTFLEKVSGLHSHLDPEALHELNQEYERRIQSLEFTVGHDDGMNLETIQKADIVLMGVSRTSKTPTSIYLAYKGYKVANVPLVKGLPLPPFLEKSPRDHRVGLLIDPEKLHAIRLQRAQTEAIPRSPYTDLATIREELSWSHNFFLEMGCPMVDVTNHAVEETAALVLKALHLR